MSSYAEQQQAGTSRGTYTGENRGRGNSRGGRGGGRGRGRGGGTGQQQQPAADGGIPVGSISKLKSQLRQTKRLLARDDLTPDVRTTTERRLELLETELEKANTGELERKMVTKYRGIRFFERQKILRKIKQFKKQLKDSPTDKGLLTNLFEARVDLYYVLQYPKTQKYISLFPEGVYQPPSTTATDASSTTRSELRKSIAKKMKKGELREEAEVGDLGIEGEEDVGTGGGGVGSEEDVSIGGKRSRSEDVNALESSESVEEPSKRPKKEKTSKVTEVEGEGDVHEEAETKSSRKGRESKKEKKERKEKRKQLLAGSGSGTGEEVKKSNGLEDDDFFA